MPAWDAQQYLRFERERGLACRDLVRRIELDAPARLVDLGCGPGTSAAVLRARWPGASITGVDSSPEMLRAARAKAPDVRWLEADLGSWSPEVPYDLVFSNAALQWLPDHPRLVPRLASCVAPGGAFAFQVPATGSARERWSDALAEVLERPAWRDRFGRSEGTDGVLSAEAYYDLLAPGARRVDLWDTEYVHVLEGPSAVVEWTKGTALRPLLDRLPVGPDRDAFLDAYARALAPRYPRRADGKILFPFLRRFAVAYR